MAAFMKLGDIKGEFSPSRQVDGFPQGQECEAVSSGLRGQGSSGDTVTGGDGTDLIGSDGVSGFASWQDVRDHNHDNRSNWDAICDIGPSIKQTSVADALTNGGQESYTELEWTYLTNVNGTIDYEMEAGTDLRSDNRFVFEPMDVMPRLGGSFDSGLDAAGGFQPHEVSAVQIGQPPDSELWLQTLG